MKVALHVHTNLSDGASTPEEMVQAYADLGFGAVAITDHAFMLKPGFEDRLRKLNSGLLVLPGWELDWEPWHYHHLLRIQGHQETLHVLCHPRAYFLEIAKVNERLRSAPMMIDAVEVTLRGFYTQEYNTPRIPVPKIASDDAHEISEVGRAWIEVAKTQSPDRLLQAVKAGDFSLGFV